jgi:SAM-dependent methyltransferase
LTAIISIANYAHYLNIKIINAFITMLQKIKYYLSPFYLIKHYLFGDIRDTVTQYEFGGAVLDIGCGSKPYKSLFAKTTRYVGIDYYNYSTNKDFAREGPDCYFDDAYIATLRLPFASDEFDGAVAFQVLEHHPKPQQLIDEMFRVVKIGGLLLLSAPFLGGVHESPHDYQRYTEYGLQEMVRSHKCKILQIKKQGSIFSTIAMLFNEHLNHFAAKNRMTYIFSVLIYPPLMLFSYSCILLDKIFKSESIYYNHLILIRKYE